MAKARIQQLGGKPRSPEEWLGSHTYRDLPPQIPAELRGRCIPADDFNVQFQGANMWLWKREDMLELLQFINQFNSRRSRDLILVWELHRLEVHDGFARHAHEFEIDSFLSDYVMPDQAIAYLQSPELAAADNNLYFAWINPGTKAAPVDNRFCVLRFIIGALIVIPAVCWLFYGLYIVLRELMLLIWSWLAR